MLIVWWKWGVDGLIVSANSLKILLTIKEALCDCQKQHFSMGYFNWETYQHSLPTNLKLNHCNWFHKWITLYGWWYRGFTLYSQTWKRHQNTETLSIKNKVPDRSLNFKVGGNLEWVSLNWVHSRLWNNCIRKG